MAVIRWEPTRRARLASTHTAVEVVRPGTTATAVQPAIGTPLSAKATVPVGSMVVPWEGVMVAV